MPAPPPPAPPLPLHRVYVCVLCRFVANGSAGMEYNMGYGVPHRDRQAKLKALGGRFDKERRRWYVPAGLSLTPFREYLRAPAHRDVMNAL